MLIDKVLSPARKRELKAAINEERSMRKAAAYIEQEFMEDGRVNVHVDVDELYNPMSMSGLRKLNSDIFDYIEESVKLLPSEIPIRVILHGAEEKDRADIPDMFRMHYELAARDTVWEERVNNQRMFYMTAVGVIFLVLYLFVAFWRESGFFVEILSVISGFALYEAADCFMIERHVINRSQYKATQFLTAEIRFAEDVPEGQNA